MSASDRDRRNPHPHSPAEAGSNDHSITSARSSDQEAAQSASAAQISALAYNKTHWEYYWGVRELVPCLKDLPRNAEHATAAHIEKIVKWQSDAQLGTADGKIGPQTYHAACDAMRNRNLELAERVDREVEIMFWATLLTRDLPIGFRS
jgi:hypothetical protein